tara:strand:+ start:75 stop:347 length:273 start_codon:yes stop_codon:yes gene_type:complete
MDGRKNNKGTVGNNGGRKSKSEEYQLIENLDKQREPSTLIAKMFQHIDGGSEKMLELYLGYRFGKPVQMTESKVTNVDEEKVGVLFKKPK